jgi:hypothetical protein
MPRPLLALLLSLALPALAAPESKSADPQEAYDQSFLWFREIDVVSLQSGSILKQFAVPLQGKSGRPVDGQAFYRLVGRRDLAEKYGDRSDAKLGLTIAGVALAVGGTAVGIYGLSNLSANCTNPPGLVPTCSGPDATPLIAGGGLIAVGGVLAAIGFAMDPNPVDLPQRRDLADNYNKSLREKLDAPRAAPPVTASLPFRKRIALLPIAGAHGGGLRASLAF